MHLKGSRVLCATRCVMVLEGFFKSETNNSSKQVADHLTRKLSYSAAAVGPLRKHACMHVGVYFTKYTCCSSSSHWSFSDWICSCCPSAARQASYLQSSSPESPGMCYTSVKLCSNGLWHRVFVKVFTAHHCTDDVPEGAKTEC